VFRNNLIALVRHDLREFCLDLETVKRVLNVGIRKALLDRSKVLLVPKAKMVDCEGVVE
jgi:hypothetical protein